jgi:Ca2+/H+ antiporter, TMEM165/GDT1 family
MGRDIVVFLTAFAGSFVESVEALTVVLAVGITRGWRAALLGAAAALVVLVGVVGLLGVTVLTHVPRQLFELVIGVLILALGVSWLRKAVLRTAGLKAMHDEAKKFERERTRLASGRRDGLDRVGLATSFQGVLLEGFEIAFIVFAAGAGGPSIAPAAAGAGVAVLLVAGLGVALRKPLSFRCYRSPRSTRSARSDWLPSFGAGQPFSQAAAGSVRRRSRRR